MLQLMTPSQHYNCLNSYFSILEYSHNKPWLTQSLKKLSNTKKKWICMYIYIRLRKYFTTIFQLTRPNTQQEVINFWLWCKGNHHGRNLKHRFKSQFYHLSSMSLLQFLQIRLCAINVSKEAVIKVKQRQIKGEGDGNKAYEMH